MDRKDKGTFALVALAAIEAFVAGAIVMWASG